MERERSPIRGLEKTVDTQHFSNRKVPNLAKYAGVYRNLTTSIV